MAKDAVEEGGHAYRTTDVGPEPERRSGRRLYASLATARSTDDTIRIVRVSRAAVNGVDAFPPVARKNKAEVKEVIMQCF